MIRKYKPSALTNSVPSHYARRPEVSPTVWYVIVCNVNCEKRAELGLRQKGFITYLPVLTTTVVRGKRRALVPVERALFTRYLFVGTLLPKMPFFHLRNTNGVESVVRNDGLPLAVPNDIIREIMRREETGEFDQTREPSTLQEIGLKSGQEMRVICGPFEGVVAKIRSLMPGKNAEILLRILGHEKPVKMKLAELQPVA